MFTGIITDLGIVKKIVKEQDAMVLLIETNYNLNNIALGASISCNGCCLTVTEKSDSSMLFDLSPETINKTNFANVKEGDLINLEQAMKLGDEFGGHMVSGHIDGLAKISSIKEVSENWVVRFKLPLSFAKYIVAKGSVTLNGVSLTVNNVDNDEFEVNIIPHTLKNTNLKNLKTGDTVNFEVDLISRYLEKLISK